MKTLTLAVILSMLGSAQAERIEEYIVQADLVTKIEASQVVSRGKKDRNQPIRNTMTLLQSNTDYYLLSNPPTVDADLLKLAGKMRLYRVYNLQEEHGIRRIDVLEDYSNQFNLAKDWSIPIGSGTAKTGDKIEVK